MYQLIACDLDETLLNDNHQIPQRVVDAIAAAHEKGVRFVPATGRPFESVAGVVEALGLSGSEKDYVLSFNGGVVTKNSEPDVALTCSELGFSRTEALFQEGRRRGFCMHIYTLDTCYLYNYVPEERAYIEGRMNIVETFADSLEFLREKTLVKIIYMNRDLDLLAKTEREFAESGLTDGLDVYYSSNRYLEFNAAGTNKGAGLLALAERLGVAPEDTIAIGDSPNDVSMICAAGLGCAVANASPETRAAADYVCELDNNAGGVAEVIEKFVLQAGCCAKDR